MSIFPALCRWQGPSRDCVPLSLTEIVLRAVGDLPRFLGKQHCLLVDVLASPQINLVVLVDCGARHTMLVQNVQVHLCAA